MIYYSPETTRALTYVFPIREYADVYYDEEVLEEDLICILYLENVDQVFSVVKEVYSSGLEARNPCYGAAVINLSLPLPDPDSLYYIF